MGRRNGPSGLREDDDDDDKANIRPQKTWRASFKEDLQAITGVTWEEQRKLPVTAVSAAGGRNVQRPTSQSQRKN